MNNYQNIDWYKEGSDEAVEFFNKREDAVEALQFLTHLIQHFPELDLEWIYLLDEIKEELLKQQNYGLIENFVERYRETFPGRYADEYEFIERELIARYLFHGNIEKVKERLEIIKQNPVSAIDTVTVRSLFQLIYRGHYGLALEYSKAVWKPLFENEELLFDGHMDFSMTIYLHELEQVYLAMKAGENPEMADFIKKMEKVDIGDNESVYKTIFANLSTDLDANSIRKMFAEEDTNRLLVLNVHFLKYMKEKFDLPFMLSDRFFNMMMTPELYGQSGHDGHFLYIPCPVLEDHFYDRYDNMFQSNDIEYFGKVFGLDYVNAFFHETGIIGDECFEAMRENIQVLKNKFIKTTSDDLWQMMFVFSWPPLYLPDPTLEKMFRETYNSSYRESNEIIESFFNDFHLSDRVQEEYSRLKKKELFQQDTGGELFYSGKDPYVKSGPDIERNDPCPCGSGKKYKKCCGKNN